MPQILDMHFQIALTSEHVADFGWVCSASSEGSLWIKKKKTEEDRIAVKPKFANDYVGRPKEACERYVSV